MSKSEYSYEDIPDSKKTFTRDHRYALYWYPSSHHEDRYDNDTNYEIVVWNVAEKAEVNVIRKSCKESYYLNTSDPDIVSVGFTKNGKRVVIKYDNGKVETERI